MILLLGGAALTGMAQERITLSVASSNVVVHWTGESNSSYRISWAPDPAFSDGFQVLKTRIPWTENAYTDPIHNGRTKGFYRLEQRPASDFSTAPEAVAQDVADRVMFYNETSGNYPLYLIWEAMLEVGRVTGDPAYSNYVFQIMNNKPGWAPGDPIKYDSPPFCHLDYKLYQISGDTNYLPNFIEQSGLYDSNITRSVEGAVQHDPNWPPDPDAQHMILIDRMQDYASRMAQTGQITGDTNWYAKSVFQFRVYREILRDPVSGLYSQGRGWLDDPNELSPGAWSRGHGWLLRGMVDSLLALPPGSAGFAEVQGYLEEVADALLDVQDENGMWHQLLHLPFSESYPDSTGTGLIMYNLARALHEGFLSGTAYEQACEKAYDGLLNYVTAEGLILQACPGPGPLWEMESYVRTPGETEDGESHGPFCVLFACAGKILLTP